MDRYNDGSNMVMAELPKERHRLSFSDILTIVMVLLGAAGGGELLCKVLEYYGLSDWDSIVVGVFWAVYCVAVIMKLRSDAETKKERDAAFRAGYEAGIRDAEEAAYGKR